MNKAIKYRIYPTTEQKILFAKTFGCCRKVYNLMLSDKINSYQVSKSFGKQTPAMYKEEFPYLREVDSLALANVQLNLQSAFKSCFSKSRKRKTDFLNTSLASIAVNHTLQIISMEQFLSLIRASDFLRLDV